MIVKVCGVRTPEVAELAQALHDLENATQSTPTMDRRLAFALHRLAFESQILHTDAWPGAFDAWTVDVLRAGLRERADPLPGCGTQAVECLPGSGVDPLAADQ